MNRQPMNSLHGLLKASGLAGKRDPLQVSDVQRVFLYAGQVCAATASEDLRLQSRGIDTRILASTDRTHVFGSQNVSAARERLQAERIPIIEEHTGGVEGRKLIYDTATFETSVAKVSRAIE